MLIKLKKAVDVPPPIQAFITSVVSRPFTDLATLLDGFIWKYDKGDFSHWIALFNHFDSFFEKHVKPRKDLQLKFPEGSSSVADGGAEPQFPVEDCLAVLRVSCVILENSGNKHLYSFEYLAPLLASPHPDVATAALQTLVSFIKKTHHASIRWHGHKELNVRLKAMCQGWGGKEEGLDLVTCVAEEDALNKQRLAKATTLHYEFFKEERGAQGQAPTLGATTIHVPGVDKIQASEHEILRQLVAKYNVAEEHRFQLLCKIRVCQGFGTLRGRRYVTGLRLMAFYVLFHSNPHQDDVADFFLAEPEFVNELVALCMQEDSVPVVLRALAVRALAVQLLDRSRHSAVCAAINTGGQSGVLSMLLPKVVSAVVSQGAELSATATASESAGVVAVHTGVGIGIGPSVSVAMSAGEGGPGRNKLEASTSSTEFLDALLSLVGALVASSSGCTALTDAGVIGALLPLLQDYAMEHLSVVATAIKILESFMDFSQNASTMFRDLDGLQAMIQRLGIEVGVEKLPNASSREEGEGKGTEAMATDRAEAKETSDMACEPTPTADAVSVATTTSAEAALAASAADPTAAGAAVAGTSQEPATTALVSAADAGGANSDAAFKPPSVPYARKVLIKFLLRAVAISSYAPTSGTAARPQESDAVRLFSYLRHMFDRATDFGGSLFALAASVVTDLIHHDPLCYRFLDEAGIPDAFINAIQAGVLPYGEAVVCIANTLVALCLNTGGLQKVKDSHVMDCFVPIFTSKKFSRALGGETPGVLGASLDEFFRFVPSLRSDGLDAIINIFKAICILGGDQEEITMAQEQQQQMLSKAQLLLEPSADTSMQDAAAGGDTATATDTATAPPSTDPPSEPIDTAMEESSPQPAPAAAPASTADAPVTPVAAAADPQATPQPAELAPTGSTDAEMTGGDGAVGTTAAPSGADEAEGEAGIPMDTTPPPASADETMNPADEPDSKRLYDFSTVLAQVGNKDTESFLPECINHATRMLENLLSNTETSKLFVENGGVDFLLKIHSLPKLNYTFGFSSASHPLLAVFRGLSPNHAQLLAVKTRDALAKQLGIAMESVTAIGGTCVPSMALEERDVYMKTVSTTAGLIALASAVARNATHMLQLLSMGEDPVLAKMGNLERLLMWQASVADKWSYAHELEKAAAAAKAATEGLPAPEQPAAAAAVAATSPTPMAEVVTTITLEAGATLGEAEGAIPPAAAAAAEMLGMPLIPLAVVEIPMAGADSGEDATALALAAAAAAAAPSSSKTRKRSPEELSHDILQHTVAIFRGFYVAVGKSIHTPANRRDEPISVVTLGMKAAAMGLAVLLRGNLEFQLPGSSTPAATTSLASASTAAAAEPSAAGGSGEGPISTGDAVGEAEGGGPPQVTNHLIRLAEVVHQVLFDTRRCSCHVLVLNFFVSLGGMGALCKRFGEAAEQLWSVIEYEKQQEAIAKQKAVARCEADASRDVPMSEASATTPAPGGAAAGTATGSAPSSITAPAVAPAPAAPTDPLAANGTAGSSSSAPKSPRVSAEKTLIAFLSIIKQLTNATLVFSSPQASAHLASPLLPASMQSMLHVSFKDGAELLTRVQASAMSAVLPVWRHPSLSLAGQAVMGSIVSIMNHCAEGTGTAAALLLNPATRGGPGAAAGGAGGIARAMAMRGFQPDPQVVSSIVDMGFSRARSEEALRRMGTNNIEAAMEWLIANSEEAGPAGGADAAGAGSSATAADSAAATEEEQLADALKAALAAISASPLLETAGAAAGAEGVPAAEAEAAAAAAAAEAAEQQLVPGPAQMVEGAVSVLAQSPDGVFSVVDLLCTMACKEGGKERPAVVSNLMKQALGDEVGESGGSSEPPSAPPANAATAMRLLLLYITRDGAAREAAADSNLIPRILTLLETWSASYTASVGALEHLSKGKGSGEESLSAAEKEERKKTLLIPVWVEAALLTLDCMAGTSSTRAQSPPLNLPGSTPATTPGQAAGLVAAGDVADRATPSATAADASTTGAVLPAGPAASAAATTTTATATAASADGAAPSEAAPTTTLEGDVLMEGDAASAARAARAAAARAAATAAATSAAVAAAEFADIAAAAGFSVEDFLLREGATAASLSSDRVAAAATAAGAARIAAREAGATPAAATAAATAAAAAVYAASRTAAAASTPPTDSQSLIPMVLGGIASAWRPCGLLSEPEQERALALCLSLLKQLHAHADEWAPPLEEALTYDILTPSPGATTQAVLQLLAHITRRHSAAMQVLNQGGHRLLLSFPAGCLLPLVTRLESSVVTILRHILEDPETLESWMEAEIRNFFSQRSAFQHMSSLGTFLNALSRVYNREPVVFFKTATRVCELNMVVGSDRMIRLKSKPKDASSAMPPPPPPPPPGTAARPDAVAAGTTPTLTPTPTPGAEPPTPTPAPGASTPAPPAAPSAGDATNQDQAPKESARPRPQTAPKPPAGKKHVPASFVEVINSLVEVILSYKGPEQTPTPADTSAGASAADVQPKRDQQGADAAAPSDMQLDTGADSEAGASTSTAAAATPAPTAAAAADAAAANSSDFNVQLMHLLQPSSLAAKFASLAPEVMTQTMALKSLAEFCLIFNSTVGLLLKRDTELWPKYKASLGPEFGSSPTAAAATSTDASTTAGNKSVPSTPATKGAGHPASGTGAPIGVTAAPSRAGALIKQVMHHQLVAEHQPLLMPSLGECVVMLLQAVCVRSADGRRRVINELVGTLMVGSASTAHSAEALPLLAPPPEFDSIERQLALNAGPGSSGAFMTKPGYPAPTKVRAMINLVNSLLSAPAPPSRMGAGQAPSAVLSSEMLRTLRESGAIRALTATLRLVNMDHPYSGKAVTAVLKPLETLTRNLRGWSVKQGAPPKSGATQPESAVPRGGAPPPTPGSISTPAPTVLPFGEVIPTTRPEDLAQQAAAGPAAMHAAARLAGGHDGPHPRGRQSQVSRLMEEIDLAMEQLNDEDDDNMGEGEDEDGSDEGDEMDDEDVDDDDDVVEGSDGDEGGSEDGPDGMAIELPGHGHMHVVDDSGEDESEDGMDLHGSSDDEHEDEDGEDDEIDEGDDGDIHDDDDEDLEHHLHDEDESDDDHPHGGSEEEDVMDGANVVEVAEMDEDEDAAAAAAFNAMQDDMDGDMGLGMEEADGAGEEDGHEEGEDEDEDEDEEVDEEGSEEEYDHEEDGDMVRMRNLNIDPRLLPLLDHHRQGVGAAGRLWDMELDDRHGFGADLAGGAQAVPTLSQMLGEAVNMFDRQHGRRLSRTLATNQSSPIQLMSSLMSTQHRMLARPAAPRDGAAIGAGAGSAASQANAVSSLMTLASRYNPADFDGAGLGDGEVAEFRNLLRAGPPGDAVRAAGLHFLNMPSTVAGRPILRLDTNGGPISLMGGPEGRTAAGLMSAATGASLAAGSGDSSHIDTRMLETQLLSVLRADAASAAAAAGVTLPTTAASAHQTAADAATLAAMQVDATVSLMAPPATTPAGAGAAASAPASTPAATPAPTPPPSAPAAGGPASTTAPGLISPNLFGEALVAASAAAARSVGVRTHAADLARALATGLQAARDAAETAGAGTAAPTTPAPTLPTPVVTPAPLAPPAPEADPSNAPMVDTATGEAAAAAASDRQPEPMEVEEEEPRAVAEPMATEPPPASASTLDERLRTAAVNAGIDLAFLEALPDDLRAEVLSMHGAAASSAAAPPPTLPGPPPTGGAAAPLVSAAPPASGAATPAEGSAPPAAAATAPPATAAEPVAQTGAAGSAGQAAAAAPESAADEDGGPEEGGLDPEFLAALPPDIQQELLAQQRLEQRRREAQRQRRVVERSQAAATAATAAAASASAAAAPAVPGTAAAGAEAGATGEAGTAAGVGDAAAPARAPGELDLASLLATFPPDVREDVLLTSDEALLQTLPPAMLAEAQVLRSRFQREATLSDDFMASLGMAGPSMPRMSLFGGRPPPEADLRAAFSNTLRRFAPGGPGNPTGGVPVGQRVHRTTGPGPGGTHPGSRALVATASASGAVMGAEMRLQDSSAAAALDSTSPPLMSQDDLMSLVGLLRVSQPATKAPLQRVLLNLCCHAATRRSLLRNMLAMVGPDVAEEDDKQPDVSDMATDTPPTAAAPSSAVPPTSSAVPIDLDVLGTAPEEASPQEELDMRAGVQPDQTSAPQVQRRMLEMVTFLSKHSKQVARMLLLLNIPLSPATTSAELAAAAASAAEQARKGKAPVNAAKPAAEDEDERKALELLLSSLGHPLCKRSTTTMEMVLLLLELILKAGSAYADELKAHVDAFEQAAELIWRSKKDAKPIEGTSTAAEAAAPGGATPMDTTAPPASTSTSQAPSTESGQPGPKSSAPVAEASASEIAQLQLQLSRSSEAGPSSSNSPPQPKSPFLESIEQIVNTLHGLPEPLLQNLAQLLAQPDMSEPTYARAGNVIKSLIDVAPTHLPLILRELGGELQRLAQSTTGLLARAMENGGLGSSTGPADTSQLAEIAQQGSMMLRMLHALQGFRKDKERLALSTMLNKAIGASTSWAKLAAAPDRGAAAGASGSGASGSGSGSGAPAAGASGSGASGSGSGAAAAGASGSGSGAPSAGASGSDAAATTAAPTASSAGVSTAGGDAMVTVSGREPAAAAAAATGAQPVSTSAPSLPAETPTEPTVSDTVKSAVEAMSGNLDPLWQTVSSCINSIEEQLNRGAAAGSAAEGSGAIPAADAAPAPAALPAEAAASMWGGRAAAVAATMDPAAAVGSTAAARLLPTGATQVLPLVESFFVLCRLQDAIPPAQTVGPAKDEAFALDGSVTALQALALQLKTQQEKEQAQLEERNSGALDGGTTSAASLPSHESAPMALASVGSVPLDEKHAAFLKFAERHRRLLNAYLRRQPTLLETSLSPLLRVHKLIDFDNKRSYFRSKVRQQEDRVFASLRITVRREHVFEDSFHQLRSRDGDQMRMKLNVQFQGEEGIDAGGVSREWYQVMAREMFNPNLALFVQVPEGGTTFQPNPNSVVQSDRGTNHLDFFRFAGRIVGKALYDGQLMDAYFTRSFYKHMLGLQLTYEDIEGVDPGYYKNLCWMLENDITDVLDLNFTAELDFFGRKEIVDLVPGGKDIRVTESNKREYVNLVARHRMTTAIRTQILAFLEGFWELVPKNLIQIFNDHELELLISGLPDIDVSDLRSQTEYTGFSAASPVIQWFWEAVGEMDKESLALLLQFVTGTSKVPLEGFKSLQGISGPQKFQIHKAYGPSDRLPSAHTCFNQLDLPEYESKEQLVEKMKMALFHGSEGFGFG